MKHYIFCEADSHLATQNNNLLASVDLEGLLLWLQEPTTGPFSVPDDSIPHITDCIFKMHFTIKLPSVFW